MSLLSVRYLKARATMGAALLQHLLSVPFTRRRGAAPWLRRLAKEDLAAAPEQVWTYVAGTSRCLACGLCDVTVAEGSPAELLQGAVRQPADALLVTDRVEELRATAQAIAKICPARVPVEDVARLIEDNARMLSQAQGVSQK